MKKFIVDKVFEIIPALSKTFGVALILSTLGLIYLRVFMVDEIKAHVTPIEESNNLKFQTIIKYNKDQFDLIKEHNKNQFNLLRDDILEVKKQNNIILNKL